jgi:hypothetical protein
VTVDDRESLHHLVDRLPAGELLAARRYLEYLQTTAGVAPAGEQTIVLRLTIEGGSGAVRVAGGGPSLVEMPTAARLPAPPEAPEPVAAAALPPARGRASPLLAALGWGTVLLLVVGAAVVLMGQLVAPVAAISPELRNVPPEDQGIDFNHPLQPGVYPLWELSSHHYVVDRGQPVYVDDLGARVVLPERAAIALVDQGIDFESPLRPGIFPLRQLSTGLQIAENGLLLWVDAEGRRVPPGRSAPLDHLPFWR